MTNSLINSQNFFQLAYELEKSLANNEVNSIPSACRNKNFRFCLTDRCFFDRFIPNRAIWCMAKKALVRCARRPLPENHRYSLIFETIQLSENISVQHAKKVSWPSKSHHGLFLFNKKKIRNDVSFYNIFQHLRRRPIYEITNESIHKFVPMFAVIVEKHSHKSPIWM